MWGPLFGALMSAAVSKAENIPHELFKTFSPAFKPILDVSVADTLKRVIENRLAGDETTLASLDAHYAAFRQLL
jgi:hypothetical protein